MITFIKVAAAVAAVVTLSYVSYQESQATKEAVMDEINEKGDDLDPSVLSSIRGTISGKLRALGAVSAMAIVALLAMSPWGRALWTGGTSLWLYALLGVISAFIGKAIKYATGNEVLADAVSSVVSAVLAIRLNSRVATGMILTLINSYEVYTIWKSIINLKDQVMLRVYGTMLGNSMRGWATKWA